MEKIFVVYCNQNNTSFGNVIVKIDVTANYNKSIPEKIVEFFKDENNKYKPFYNAVLINYFKI